MVLSVKTTTVVEIPPDINKAQTRGISDCWKVIGRFTVVWFVPFNITLPNCKINPLLKNIFF